MVVESIPPLSQIPSGTSEIMCSRTDCCSRLSSSSFAVSRVMGRLRERQFPICIRGYLSVAPLQPMPRRKFFDSFHESPGTGHIVQREIAIESMKAQPAFDLRMDKNGFQLGAEKKI